MPFQRPTLSELIARITADFVSRLALAGAVLRRSVIAVFARVEAAAVHGLYGYIEYLSRQFFADTAEDEWLLRKAALYGIYPQDAVPASGDIQFTISGANITIPEGTVVQRTDGVQFATTADLTIVAGSGTVEVEALVAGANGNTPSGAPVTLVSPITGVFSQAVVGASGIVDGSDQESVESVRERLLNRLRQPPHGGAAADYVTWAREVPGVTRAWVYPAWLGPGTVGVTFVTDGADPIIPTPTKVDEVQAYIDTVKPVTADVTVFAPEEFPVDITLSITPDNTAVRQAAEAEIADLFTRVGEPGATIYPSQISEAVSLAQGEEHHDLTVPAAPVTPAANEIPVLGTITWL